MNYWKYWKELLSNVPDELSSLFEGTSFESPQ